MVSSAPSRRVSLNLRKKFEETREGKRLLGEKEFTFKGTDDDGRYIYQTLDTVCVALLDREEPGDVWVWKVSLLDWEESGDVWINGLARAGGSRLEALVCRGFGKGFGELSGVDLYA